MISAGGDAELRGKDGRTPLDLVHASLRPTMADLSRCTKERAALRGEIQVVRAQATPSSAQVAVAVSVSVAIACASVLMPCLTRGQLGGSGKGGRRGRGGGGWQLCAALPQACAANVQEPAAGGRPGVPGPDSAGALSGGLDGAGATSSGGHGGRGAEDCGLVTEGGSSSSMPADSGRAADNGGSSSTRSPVADNGGSSSTPSPGPTRRLRICSMCSRSPAAAAPVGAKACGWCSCGRPVVSCPVGCSELHWGEDDVWQAP